MKTLLFNNAYAIFLGLFIPRVFPDLNIGYFILMILAIISAVNLRGLKYFKHEILNEIFIEKLYLIVFATILISHNISILKLPFWFGLLGLLISVSFKEKIFKNKESLNNN